MKRWHYRGIYEWEHYLRQYSYGEVFYKKINVFKLRYKIFVKCRFRVDPVPHTGRSHWRFGHFYKKPKTTQEKIQSLAYDRKYVRGKRRKPNLPEVCDDKKRSDLYIKRSWKKGYKVRKQWMKHI